MISSLDLTVAPRENESLCISATSDMEWQGGHRSLGLIVPDGRHQAAPGGNTGTALLDLVNMCCLCVCVCVCVRERDSKIERERDRK